MLKFLKGFAKEMLFGRMLRNMQVTQVLTSRVESKLVFGIVHWNAPHFLTLNVKQLRRLHPESKIYVFDNASSSQNFEAVVKGLEGYENVTLFSNRKDYSQTWACQIMGLQFLLNYAEKQGDSVMAFLDQDCMLVNRVDDLASKLNGDTLLVGVRDYVEKTHDYELLKKGLFRMYPDAVHSSFMMMQPCVVNKLFGDESLFDGYLFEAYHGLSKKAKGKIVFLETEMHPEIPMLTRYFYGDKTYAWHSWFSSRVYGMKNDEVLNFLPVAWIRNAVNQAYEFMLKLGGG